MLSEKQKEKKTFKEFCLMFKNKSNFPFPYQTPPLELLSLFPLILKNSEITPSPYLL